MFSPLQSLNLFCLNESCTFTARLLFLVHKAPLRSGDAAETATAQQLKIERRSHSAIVCRPAGSSVGWDDDRIRCGGAWRGRFRAASELASRRRPFGEAAGKLLWNGLFVPERLWNVLMVADGGSMRVWEETSINALLSLRADQINELHLFSFSDLWWRGNV